MNGWEDRLRIGIIGETEKAYEIPGFAYTYIDSRENNRRVFIPKSVCQVVEEFDKSINKTYKIIIAIKSWFYNQNMR